MNIKILGYLVDRGLGFKMLTQNFHCAFVQDSEKSPATCTLYFNGEPVGKLTDSLGEMSSWTGIASAILLVRFLILVRIDQEF